MHILLRGEDIGWNKVKLLQTVYCDTTPIRRSTEDENASRTIGLYPNVGKLLNDSAALDKNFVCLKFCNSCWPLFHFAFEVWEVVEIFKWTLDRF